VNFDEFFEPQDITKAQLKALLSNQSKHGVLVFYDNGVTKGPQDYYAFLQPDGRILIKATPHRQISFGLEPKEIIHVCRNFDDFWKYLQTKLSNPSNYYYGAFRYMSDEDVKREQQYQLKMQHAEAQDAGSWDAYRNKSLTKAQLQFRLPTKMEHPSFDLFRRKIFGPFKENYYVKAHTYPGGSPTMTVYKNDGRTESSVTTFSTINALWEYIIMMVSDHKHYEAAYKYVDPRLKLKESLTGSKRDPFHEAIFDVIDYLTEFEEIFPVPKNIGSTNWMELKDDINYGLSSDFEIAEILMEYLQKDLAITKKHPEMFEDDPQSELTLEMYIKLKRAFDIAVAAYEAAHPEDFQESFSNEAQSTELNESFLAGVATAAGKLALDIFQWTIGGYIGFTVGGWIWDRTKDLIRGFIRQIRKVIHQNDTSQWIAYKSYLIEITEDYQINIWNPGGDQIATNVFSVETAKFKIDRLPIPEIISEFSLALEDSLSEEPSELEQELPSVELDPATVVEEDVPESFSMEPGPTDLTEGILEDLATEAADGISDGTNSEKAISVNSSEINGLDFEDACKKYGVTVES
jgi:hypothetical protein